MSLCVDFVDFKTRKDVRGKVFCGFQFVHGHCAD